VSTSYRPYLLILVLAALCACAFPAFAQDLGDIMKDNVAETSRTFGQGWITIISLIGWILFPIGLFGLVSAMKDRGEWKGPAAAMVIGALALAVVYIPGLFTQTVLRQDAEGLDDLGVE
jgi:4-hydroxybenzoate polyprenyltransferase